MRLELDRQIQTGNLAVSKQDVDTERIMEAAYLEEEKRQADMEFAISQAELAMNKDTDEKKIKVDLKKKSNTQQIGN
jgi:3-isopropylmalate dehydratase small subunit